MNPNDVQANQASQVRSIPPQSATQNTATQSIQGQQQTSRQLYDAAQHRQSVRSARSVYEGTQAFVQGFKQRLEQIAGNPNDAAVREDVRSLAGELDSQVNDWSNDLAENTPSKNEPDPNAAAPVAPRINV